VKVRLWFEHGTTKVEIHKDCLEIGEIGVNLQNRKNLFMELKTDLYLGDCRKELKKIPDNSVDLIVTSPPYADQRVSTYGGISRWRKKRLCNGTYS